VPRSPLLRAALAAAFSLAVIAPAGASAADGTYTVYACKGPAGAPAPATGWNTAATPQASVANACTSGGPFTLGLAANAAGGQGAQWAFTAPAGTRISGFNMLRLTQGFAGMANTSTIYSVVANGSAPDGNNKDLERCVKDGDACQADLNTPVSKPGLDASALTINLTCGLVGFAVCTNPAASVAINQAVVTLKDPSKPVVYNNGIVDAGDTSGVLKVKFDATDQGGGLYRVNTLVDGQLFSSTGLGADPCVDANPADADSHQFLAPQPCPLGVAGGLVAVDYTKLAPGPHTVQTEVEDAAGNTSAVSVTQFPRVNIDGPDGSGTGTGNPGDYDRLRQAKVRAWFPQGKKHPRSAEVPYGERTVIRGQVVDRAGKGIVGARVDVYHVTRGGKRRLVKTGLKTRTQGRLTYIVSKRLDTRKIELTFRALRPGPITSKERLSVRVVRKGETFYLKENRPAAKKATAAKK
jgi:hypothetical protein